MIIIIIIFSPSSYIHGFKIIHGPLLGSIIHQAGAQPKHENAKLHLAQSSVAVQIAFHQHANELVVSQIMQPQKNTVPLQALERYKPLLNVHEKAKTVA